MAEDGGVQAGGGQQTTVQAAQQGGQQATPEQIAASILQSIESRNRRSESGIVKSYAEQYGMSENEIAGILEREKQRRATELSPEQKKSVDAQIAKANERLISAEVKAVGASVGLLDTDAAAVLMDRSKVKVTDDGNVEGVKEALEALRKAKPYMFGAAAQPKTGMRQRGTEGTPNPNAEANAALRELFGKENR